VGILRYTKTRNSRLSVQYWRARTGDGRALKRHLFCNVKRIVHRKCALLSVYENNIKNNVELIKRRNFPLYTNHYAIISTFIYIHMA